MGIEMILVEDDKPTAKEFIDYFDTLDDFNIIGIADGATNALEMIKRDRPSVVIVDIVLQESSGTVLVKNLMSGEHLNYIPCVIVVTALKVEKKHRQLESYGIAKLYKKYDKEFKIKQVGEWLKTNYEELPKINKEAILQ